MGGTLLRHLLQREYCVTLSPWCCWMPANHGRTKHRANFGGAQQSHWQLGLWQIPWQRWDPPRPTKAQRDHLTAFSACTPLSVLARSCTTSMWDTKIITLFKNKGERSDSNNYRGISLLSVNGKVFAKVILIWLQKLAERVYLESQCGFWAGRSTIDMVFSLRQLQVKCREQQMPLYIAFIDLTKAFDLVSRDGLFQILPKIGCPPKSQSMIKSFHTNMKGTVQFNGSSSRPFDIRSGFQQWCVLAPTLFGIFFALLLRHTFGTASEGICLQTRSDGRLFNLGHLRAKTKVHETLIRDMLFADDAAANTQTQQELQALMDRLTISLKKTIILGQDTMELPAITIDDYELNVVEQFTYLGSTITDNLSLDTEIDKKIGKAATTPAHLTSRVWTNPKLTVKTKMVVYNTCVVSTLMYGSETWTIYARQEKRLNSFYLRSIRRMLGISWQDRVSNSQVLFRANLPSMFTLLRQRRLRWLGHVYCMEDGRIPKDILYGELASGRRSKGCPQLLQECLQERHESTWHQHRFLGGPCSRPHDVEKHPEPTPQDRGKEAGECRSRKKGPQKGAQQLNRPGTIHKCDCGRYCFSHIGLYSHKRRCDNRTDRTTRMYSLDRRRPYILICASLWREWAVMYVNTLLVVTAYPIFCDFYWHSTQMNAHQFKIVTIIAHRKHEGCTLQATWPLRIRGFLQNCSCFVVFVF